MSPSSISSSGSNSVDPVTAVKPAVACRNLNTDKTLMFNVEYYEVKRTTNKVNLEIAGAKKKTEGTGNQQKDRI